MSKLKLTDLPAPDVAEEVVSVPEFGEGMEVVARGMTVLDKSTLGMHMQAWGVNDRSAVAVIAALCSRDDEGALVFGETREEAIKRAHELPEKYYPALVRISHAAVRLSSAAEGEESGAVDDEEAVAAAKKN